MDTALLMKRARILAQCHLTTTDKLLMELLAIPLSHQKTVAKRLVIAI
jgi:hypothetical protein